ncbi:hypothetical protein D3C75_1024280 [compost metagenome]
MGHGAVNGAAGAQQIGLNIGVIAIQVELIIQIIAAFGDGEGDDAGFWLGPLRGQCGQFLIPGNDLADGGNGFILTYALWGDGLQHVLALLLSQRIQ